MEAVVRAVAARPAVAAAVVAARPAVAEAVARELVAARDRVAALAEAVETVVVVAGTAAA